MPGGGFPGCRVQFLFHTFPQVLRNLHNKIWKDIPLFCLRHSQATTPRFAQYNWVITLSSKIVPWWFLWNKTCKCLRKFWGWGIQEYLLRRSIIRNMHFLRKWGKIYISCNGAAVCKHHNTRKFHKWAFREIPHCNETWETSVNFSFFFFRFSGE